MTLRGLRNDSFFATLTGEERDRYEAAYRGTLAGKLDELHEIALPLGTEIVRMVERAESAIRAMNYRHLLASLRDTDEDADA